MNITERWGRGEEFRRISASILFFARDSMIPLETAETELQLVEVGG